MKHFFGRQTSAETLPTAESSLPTKEAVRTRTAMSERPCTKKNLPQRPIDLDEISVHLKCDFASSGDITETTVSCKSSEKQRMTALTHALAGKQQDISDTFCKMVYSMAKLVREAEGSSYGEISEPIKLCKELEEQAVIMANKQALIAQHFEATVNRLEQEALDREAANQRLIAQLNTARRSLKDQAVVELEVISKTRKSQEFTPTHPPRTTIPGISLLGENFPIQETI
jgi:translation initiation factor 1 (eIF-1/SUI1)